MDLAGSERCGDYWDNQEEEGLKAWEVDEVQSKTKERIKEGQYINKSLFFLTQVISKRGSYKNMQHIPYRNTSLTKLLKSSIGGNAKTVIILCISPVKSQFNHSLQTLKFGVSASQIENRVVKNAVKNTMEETLRILVNEYQSRLATLETQGSPTSNLKQLNSLQARIAELEAENANLRDKLNNREVMMGKSQFPIENIQQQNLTQNSNETNKQQKKLEDSSIQKVLSV